ncbi:hypothetical protein L1887_45210 [Cichorium endivia]|nr:hypothetical protein L1887_45210 [Cichorium endivia]
MTHVCGLFARRAFNVEGILCLPIQGSEHSRIWLLVNDDQRLEQMMAQIDKLEDVTKVARNQSDPTMFNKIAERAMTTIALIDDHLIVRSGFAQLLNLEADFQVVAEFGSGREALAGLPGRGVQVCICDISMPDLSGLELLSQLPKGMATIMLSVHDSPALVEQALNAGARGFLSKRCSPDELIAASASGGAPGAGGAAVPLRAASGVNAPVPARLLAGFARRRVADAGLAGAGGGPRAPALIDDRKPAHASPGCPHFPLPSPARLAHAAAAGGGADGRRAAAVASVGRREGDAQRPAADPHRRPDPGADLSGDLALSHQHRLAAARPGAGFPAGELARPAPHLVSAAVCGEPVAPAWPARRAFTLHAVLPGAADYRPGLALRLAGGADRHADERHRADRQPDLARSSRGSAALPAGPEPDRAAARRGHSAPARAEPVPANRAGAQPPSGGASAGNRRERAAGGRPRATRRYRPDHHRHSHPGGHCPASGGRKRGRRLRPRQLDDLSLEQAVRSLMREMELESRGIVSHLDWRINESTLSEGQRVTLFRVCQEGLNNIVKHASASAVTIQGWQQDERLMLVIEDDGCGLPPGSGQQGFGLAGMRERVKALGGTLNLSCDKAEIDARYRYWRRHILMTIWLGYALFYFTRKSFNAAAPEILASGVMTRTDIGLLATLFYITYGLSKFFSGIVSDRSNARYFMGVGLIATGVVNILFGFSTSLWAFALLWALNAFFQGWGAPVCARLLTAWYSRNERGGWWAIWNTAHNVGGALIPMVVGAAALHYGWRAGMMIAGGLAIVAGLFLCWRLRDRPQTVGLPAVGDWRHDEMEIAQQQEGAGLTRREILTKYVLKNPYIWLLSLCYVLVYVVRAAINDWGNLYMSETLGVDLVTANSAVTMFELGGGFFAVIAIAAGISALLLLPFLHAQAPREVKISSGANHAGLPQPGAQADPGSAARRAAQDVVQTVHAVLSGGLHRLPDHVPDPQKL